MSEVPEKGAPRPRAGREAALPGGLVPVPARGGVLQWPEASCPPDRENKCGAARHPWSRVGPESARECIF
jgi:hypothetical protein